MEMNKKELNDENRTDIENILHRDEKVRSD